MNRFRRATLWAVLAAVVLLTGLSIYGAFIGADRAQAFFTSVPLTVYWFASVVLLIAGIILFRRLLRVPALLLMHAGCILVVLGMMWGSKGGHALQKRLFGIDKIPIGELWLYEQVDENRVVMGDANSLRELPFFVRLNDYRIEYYELGQLSIWSHDGRGWRMPAEAGRSLFLGDDLGTVTIRRVFKNFRIDIKADEPVAYDEPGGSNPALELAIEKPGAQPGRRYVFERRPGHANANDPLALDYHRSIKDYVSELEIVKDGQVVAAKNIEVNHPLYYGGYHIYQNKPGGQDEYGTFTGLLVVSASGLNAVYGGYVLLTGGIFWHFWGRRILNRLKTRPTPIEESQ